MKKNPKKQTKEPIIEQIASFAGFFILLLVFKTFFIPLFVIPTGSMAETLYGEHATHTCMNCGKEYPIGFRPTPSRVINSMCPNCHRIQPFWMMNQTYNGPTGLGKRVRSTFGDRIMVLGWTFDLGLDVFKPGRWDVVVFRNPNDPEVNYIKRLIGLPGEKIEIIDGDIFVNDQIARKPDHIQEQLWFPSYDHDFIPTKPGGEGNSFFPHWAVHSGDAAWHNVDTRQIAFDGKDVGRAELIFSTAPGETTPGQIEDVYGYNPPVEIAPNGREYRIIPKFGNRPVTDTRLSAEVEFVEGDGFVELSTTKYRQRLATRLYADGRCELVGQSINGQEDIWQSIDGVETNRSVQLSLGVADYCAIVKVNGQAIMQSDESKFSITPEQAEQNQSLRPMPISVIKIAAGNVKANLRHIRIDRDICYRQPMRPPATASAGRPLTLDDAQYFVMGDNSPNSEDGRFWSEETLGAHLQGRDDYQIGTVPADQMLGRAFFVYWPGFRALPINGVNIVPDFGHIRWIH